MFVVTVEFEIAPDAVNDFKPLMEANARASLGTEAGCLHFDICYDVDRPTEVFLYEIYSDKAAFEEVHLKAAHFVEFSAATADMVMSKTIKTYTQVIQ